MTPMTRRLALAALAGGALWGGIYLWGRRKGRVRAAELYANPLTAPQGPLKVFHLGHSLVGRNMPAMLAQIAGKEHLYESQLGWGTPLESHWEPEVPINGFDVENDHPRYRDAKEALGAGTYDAIVFTEMVEIRDAIKYHESARYLAEWARYAHAANPDARLYLYETWHHIDDPSGWLDRVDADLQERWLGEILLPALGRTDAPIHLIPAGQVMATFVRAVDARGGIAGIAGIEDLFARNADGTIDTIHFNDIGAYLVALTHYAVLYHRSPVGLPHQLNLADGSSAVSPSAEAALLMQEIVWEVVRRHPETGVAA
ncbi:MAG: hypothetical protein HKN30_11215 [Sulfitobacter sp.]|nr:hypothetical protein [Sulfitobacter sp.]